MGGVAFHSLKDDGLLRKYCSSSFRIDGSIDFRARGWVKNTSS